MIWDMIWFQKDMIWENFRVFFNKCVINSLNKRQFAVF